MNKIAFILCVNNESEFSEALYYIERLNVPENYEKDVIAVREAPSMTAGYNAAMKSSDAKYKVYLHQDTFIINRNFISELLSIFQADEEIGMVGCVGCDELPLNAKAVVSWNMGKVYHNCVPNRFIGTKQAYGPVIEAEALDGLLLATQYDVEWREDLFDGWDFYDISQCFEMKRAGYKVAVANQEKTWCYHDNSFSKFRRYQEFCVKFAQEYQDFKTFVATENSDRINEYEQLKEASRIELRNLVDIGAKLALRQVFEVQENKGFLHLRDFEIFSEIDAREARSGKEWFWENGTDYDTLMEKLSALKFALKRIEYSADEDNVALEFLVNNYSMEAIETVHRFYKVESVDILEEINKSYYRRNE